MDDTATCTRCSRTFRLDDSPMLRDDLWYSFASEHEWLCLACIEATLKRGVVESDLMMRQDDDGSVHHVPWNNHFIKQLKNRKCDQL